MPKTVITTLGPGRALDPDVPRYVIIPFIITIRERHPPPSPTLPLHAHTQSHHNDEPTGFHARFSLDGRKLPGTDPGAPRAPSPRMMHDDVLIRNGAIVNRHLIRERAAPADVPCARSRARIAPAYSSPLSAGSFSGTIKF